MNERVEREERKHKGRKRIVAAVVDGGAALLGELHASWRKSRQCGGRRLDEPVTRVARGAR